MRKKTGTPKIERRQPDVPVGAECWILRPNLWSGCRCVVEKVSPEGVHLLRVDGKDGAVFHAEAKAHELEVSTGEENFAEILK